MKYQKIINLLINGVTQPSKVRTKSWIEINGDARGNVECMIPIVKVSLRLRCWS